MCNSSMARNCQCIYCTLVSVFKHIVFCVSTGLSLYFEDGHDDLDDCEYTELVSYFTDQHLSVNVAG